MNIFLVVIYLCIHIADVFLKRHKSVSMDKTMQIVCQHGMSKYLVVTLKQIYNRGKDGTSSAQLPKGNLKTKIMIWKMFPHFLTQIKSCLWEKLTEKSNLEMTNREKRKCDEFSGWVFFRLFLGHE